MPRKSGVSHVIGGIVVLMIGPFVKELLKSLVDGSDLNHAITQVSEHVSEHPYLPTDTDLVSTILTVAVLVLLLFLWGVAYHLKRHGDSQSYTSIK